MILPEGTYPYWPEYNYLVETDLKNIKAQEWKNIDHVIEGWDWSLPGFVKQSPRSFVGLQLNIGWDNSFMKFELPFNANPVGLLWLKDLGVAFLPQRNTGDNLNFGPAHPKFHERYLKLISELSKTEIPGLVKNAYFGYASHSFGDEGIGPYGETSSAANDTVKHVRERLDEWGNAFKGMETKVYMGGSCDYGFKKGFGTRRGFVEMYLYRIPNIDLGQYVDSNGYLSVDENAPIIR